MTTTGEQTTDRRPLHERIAADLRDEILSGAVLPGTALLSDELRHRFAASGPAVLRALEMLEDEGLITGDAGIAAAPDVLVLQHRQKTMRPSRGLTPAVPGQPYRWIVEARKRGVRASCALLEVKVVAEPPAPVVQALRLSAAWSAAVLRSQVLTFDDEPVGVVKSYFPLDIARGTALMERRRVRGGTPTLLSQLGYPPRRCVDSVSARIPTQEQYALLRLPSSLPVLRTFRVVYSDNDRPVEVNDTVEAGHLYELQYEFSPMS
ncbi:GntR family transcriptional regulator [Streptomyces sp. NBRC 110611]|uniref:GntR family transcriptional regulator n=1 Tax=Streptomyces sp. NBRC 110611 TaxID=1621259 RepID=UPI00082F1F62|nr:GntR family transcriptional regulator [Streptomyces sp. NBRC 110611]GAU65213.1 GntR family transcriptional regulator [Streptomyces sp. NBRC 110611]